MSAGEGVGGGGTRGIASGRAESTDRLLLVSARDIKGLSGHYKCEHNDLMSQAGDCGIRERSLIELLNVFGRSRASSVVSSRIGKMRDCFLHAHSLVEGISDEPTLQFCRFSPLYSLRKFNVFSGAFLP